MISSIRRRVKQKAVMLAILAMILGGFVSSTGAMAAPRIIGGHEPQRVYSAIASLQIAAPGDPNAHLCGASLISRTYAITNAHCVTYEDATPADPSLFHLRIGSNDRSSGGVVVGVAKVLPHADWKWMEGTAPTSDIALLKLDGYVQQQPFEVAPSIGKNNTTTRLLGWGVTEPSGEGPLPLQLQELDTKIVNKKRCSAAGITAGELCVSNVNGTNGPCFADSGSPALQKVTSRRWSIVGSMSRIGGVYCGTGSAVYTDVTYFREWTYTVMRTGKVPASKNKVTKPVHTSTRLDPTAWRQ